MLTRKSLLQEIVGKLKEIQNLKVDTRRIFPKAPKDCPLIIVEPFDVEWTSKSLPKHDASMQFQLMIYAKSPQEGDDLVDIVIEKLLTDLYDGYLGADSVQDVSPKSMKYDFESMGDGISWLNLVIEIKFRENF